MDILQIFHFRSGFDGARSVCSHGTDHVLCKSWAKSVSDPWFTVIEPFALLSEGLSLILLLIRVNVGNSLFVVSEEQTPEWFNLCQRVSCACERQFRLGLLDAGHSLWDPQLILACRLAGWCCGNSECLCLVFVFNV
jgi:hypothetical protein